MLDKTAVVHQPYFLPWLGYFNKLLYATDLVFLDTLPFRPRHYENRVHIKDNRGQRAWISLAIKGTPSRLKDARLADSKTLERAIETVRRAYSAAPFFADHWGEIANSLRSGAPWLTDINVNSTKYILGSLGLQHINFKFASNLPEETDPTLRLIMCCHEAKCSRLIMGQGGSMDCHDLELVRMSGIQTVEQDFYNNHPRYAQLRGDFVPYLSIIDALLNVGAAHTRDLLEQSWRPTW